VCLAIPAKITARKGDEAEVDIMGVRRKVNVALVPDAREGDYVLLHAGCAISVIDEDDAKETIAAWEEIRRLEAEEATP